MTTPNPPVTRRFLFVDEALTAPPADAAGKPNGYTRVAADGTIYIVKDGAYVASGGAAGGGGGGGIPWAERAAIFCATTYYAVKPPRGFDVPVLFSEIADSTFQPGDTRLAADLVLLIANRGPQATGNNYRDVGDSFNSVFRGLKPRAAGYYQAYVSVEFDLSSGLVAGDKVTLRIHDSSYDYTITANDITEGYVYLEFKTSLFLRDDSPVQLQVLAKSTALFAYADFNIRAVTESEVRQPALLWPGAFTEPTKTGNSWTFTISSLPPPPAGVAAADLRYTVRLEATNGTQDGNIVELTGTQVVDGYQFTLPLAAGRRLGAYQVSVDTYVYADPTDRYHQVRLGLVTAT